ncbi:Cytochrome P450 6a19 [Carabus blaptoides fortunei]
MVKYTNLEPIRLNLKFGVELYELNPPWYLHPSLKNLMYLAKISIKHRDKRQYALHEFSRPNFAIQGTTHERLLLKQRLITCKSIFNLHIAPGVPIWLLRHFLELLPTPIFPPQNDAHHWRNLSTKCHKSSSKEIKDIVAKELACLPARNLTFLFEFFELIRSLATDDFVDSSISIIFVKYFASSLFSRPYMSEVAESDDKYNSLLLFIIYFWPELRLQIHNVIITRDKNINSFYYYCDKYSEDYYKDTSRYLTDKNVQTDSSADVLTYMNTSNNFEHFDTSLTDPVVVERDNGECENNNNNVKVCADNEVEQQTLIKELSDNEITKDEAVNEVLITSTPFKPVQKCVVDNVDTFNEMLDSIKVYLSSMYNKPEVVSEYLNRNSSKTEPASEPNKEQTPVKNKVKYSKKAVMKRQKLVRNNEISQTEMICNSTINENDYIFDSFIGKYYDTSKINDTSVNTSCILENSLTETNDMYDRIKKFGWTYNPGYNLENTHDSTQIEPYRLCYDNDQSESFQDCLNGGRNSVMDSLKRVTSKFGFLKNLTPSRLRFGRVMSSENLVSNIKYKRLPKSAQHRDMILFVVLTVVLVVLIHWFLTSPYGYWKKKGVPHPEPSMFTGNMGPSLTMKKNLSQIYRDIYYDFKDLLYVGYYKFRQPGIVLRDLDLIKSVLVKEFSSFHDNDLEIDAKVDPLFANNPFVLRGQKWKEVRNLVTTGITNSKVKNMMYLMVNVTKNMVRYLETNPEATGRHGLETKELATKYTTDVVASCAFGLEANCFTSARSEFREMGKKFLSPSFWNSIKMTVIWVLPPISKLLRIKLMPTDVQQWFLSIIKETINYRTKNNIVRNDYLDMLLSLKTSTEGSTKFGLAQTKIAIIAVISNFEVTVNQKTQRPLKIDPKYFMTCAVGGLWLNFTKINK